MDIAKWNGITKPYLIRAGQRLRLRPSAAAADSRADSAAESTAKQSAAAKAAPDADAPAHWRWPAGGQLIGRFSRRQGHNGIKIAGRAGSLVRAAAAGEVMYVGAALLGYGNLIIIKHSATYLSAYAHNQKILVAEGERIRINQPIAAHGQQRRRAHHAALRNPQKWQAGGPAGIPRLIFRRTICSPGGAGFAMQNMNLRLLLGDDVGRRNHRL